MVCACYLHWDEGIQSVSTLSDISSVLTGWPTQSRVSPCACRFDIVLMKEGRMKGQAFVGLPSERCAEKALRETNGYVLHDRPLVVVSFSSSLRSGNFSTLMACLRDVIVVKWRPLWPPHVWHEGDFIEVK